MMCVIHDIKSDYNVAIYDINIHFQDNHNIFNQSPKIPRSAVFILTPKDLPFTKLDLVPLFKPQELPPDEGVIIRVSISGYEGPPPVHLKHTHCHKTTHKKLISEDFNAINNQFFQQRLHFKSPNPTFYPISPQKYQTRTGEQERLRIVVSI